MSTATEEVVDLDINLDDVPKCDSQKSRGEPAEWLGTTVCCKRTVLGCARHVEEEMAEPIGLVGYLCYFCDAHMYGRWITWRPL